MNTTPKPAGPIVHFIWLGSPLPADYATNIDDYRRLNPTHQIRMWDDNAIRDEHIEHQRVYDAADRIVPADSIWQLRSDVARYSILHRHGGIYADTDYHWQKPLPERIAQPGHTLVTAWEIQDRHVANGFISTPAGHPGLRAALDAVPDAVARRTRGVRANRITGPSGLWTRVATQYARIEPAALFHPVPWTNPEWVTERSYPDAIAVHQWGHQQAIRPDINTTTNTTSRKTHR